MARYKCVKIHGKTVKEHKLIWEKAHGPIPKGYEIHHINGNGKDNRLENLMMLSHTEHKQLHAKLRREGRDVVDPNDPDVIATRERDKRSYQLNRESVIEWQRNYRQENKEKISEQKHRYQVNNREMLSVKHRAYYTEHHDELIDYQKAYRKTHSAELAAYAR